jgi:hypothetical protein
MGMRTRERPRTLPRRQSIAVPGRGAPDAEDGGAAPPAAARWVMVWVRVALKIRDAIGGAAR